MADDIHPADRRAFLLAGLSKSSKLVEVGPSYNPLVPKRDGWNTFIIDHASREDLVAKYEIHAKAIDVIEEVDFIWRGGSLADALPEDQRGTFDAFIASHVIEHTPDIVTFLQAARTVVRPDGLVILAVPDKRKCFDFYRQPSSTADAVVAFEERRDRHELRTHIEYSIRTVLKAGMPAWFDTDTRPVEIIKGLDDLPITLSLRFNNDYVDAHNWIFVPSSFRLMMLELGQTGYIDLEVDELVERPDTEFLVRMRPGFRKLDLPELQARRRALSDQILIEIAEQTRQIEGAPLYVVSQPPPPPRPRRRWWQRRA